MEDLIRAVNIIHNQGRHNIQEITLAKEYCNSFVESNFKNWHFFFEYFQNDQNDELIRFWVVQALTEIATNKMRKSLDFSIDEKKMFLDCATMTLSNYPQAILTHGHFLKKYTQLLARVYEQIGIDVSPKIPDLMIEQVIIPLQGVNMELYFGYCTFFVEFVHEIYQIIKEQKTEDYMRTQKLRVEFSRNSKVTDFLLYLSRDQQNTPLLLRANILLIFNKMIKSFDLDLSQQQKFLPIAIENIDLQDPLIVSNSIKFLTAYLNNSNSFDEQLEIVFKIFSNLPQWKANPNEDIFKSIAKLFTKVVNIWSSRLIKNDPKRVLKENKFAYQLKAEQKEDKSDEEEHESFEYDSDESNEEIKTRMSKMRDERMTLHMIKKMEQRKAQNEKEEDQVLQPKELTQQQLQILEIFDQIFELSMQLFQFDSLKIQIIISDLFQKYLFMILKSSMDRFSEQLNSMVQLVLLKLRYPDWYDIKKKTTESEDEEHFKELRDELVMFLNHLLSKSQYSEGIIQIIDQKINLLLNQDPTQVLDVRELDVIFTLLGILLSKTRQDMSLSQALQKYSIILFSDRIQKPDCIIFADVVLDIYQYVKLEQLDQVQLKALISYLFSENGMLSTNQSLQTQACSIFIREFRLNYMQYFLPFVEQLLKLIGNQIISKIGQLIKDQSKFSNQIFQVLGQLLCEQHISLAVRQEAATVYLQKIYYTLKELSQDPVRQNYLLNIINFIQKGFQQQIEDEILQIFLMMLEQLLQDITNQAYQEQVCCGILKLFTQRISIFKDKTYIILRNYIQAVCEKCSFNICAEYFKAWNEYMLSSDSKLRIFEFTFENFDQLQLYVQGTIGLVESVKTEQDRSKSEIQENIIKVLKESAMIDYRFLLSKGEESFTTFFKFLVDVYDKSFAIKTRYEAIDLLYIICSQFFNCMDEEFSMSQQHIQKTVQYAPNFLTQAISQDLFEYMQHALEYIAVWASSRISKFGNDMNDKVFSKIVLIQDIALKTLYGGGPEAREKLRFRMKNEAKIYYHYVLENLKMLDKYRAGDISKFDLQKLYTKCMNNQLEEKILKASDD